MTKEQVQKLRHGLYVIHWKTGGVTLGAVGSDYSGARWLACSNWTSQKDRPVHSSTIEMWEGVAKVGLICQSRY